MSREQRVSYRANLLVLLNGPDFWHDGFHFENGVITEEPPISPAVERYVDDLPGILSVTPPAAPGPIVGVDRRHRRGVREGPEGGRGPIGKGGGLALDPGTRQWAYPFGELP